MLSGIGYETIFHETEPRHARDEGKQEVLETPYPSAQRQTRHTYTYENTSGFGRIHSRLSGPEYVGRHERCKEFNILPF